jgi:hypothetical protein
LRTIFAKQRAPAVEAPLCVFSASQSDIDGAGSASQVADLNVSVEIRPKPTPGVLSPDGNGMSSIEHHLPPTSSKRRKDSASRDNTSQNEEFSESSTGLHFRYPSQDDGVGPTNFASWLSRAEEESQRATKALSSRRPASQLPPLNGVHTVNRAPSESGQQKLNTFFGHIPATNLNPFLPPRSRSKANQQKAPPSDNILKPQNVSHFVRFCNQMP